MIAIRRNALAIYACIVWSCCATAFAADGFQGVAQNQTEHRIAAGDTVILLRPNPENRSRAGSDQKMQEEARTTTDAEGRFTLTAPSAQGWHLLRVVHQGINYDRWAKSGAAVSIDVFDAAVKVRGLRGSIEIVRLGTDGSNLVVSDMVEIVNVSSPQRTQAGERTFEVYLPAGARIESVLASGPNAGSPTGAGGGTIISPVIVPGEPEHYTVNFPLRPGATQFAFNYELPYDGHAAFHAKGVYPVRQLAVMFPPTMTFTSRSSTFEVLHVGNGSYKVEAAENVPAGDRPEFEISGTGAIPLPQTTVQAPAQVRQKEVSPGSPRSQLATASPELHWWVLGAGALLLLAGWGLLIRRNRRVSVVAPRTPAAIRNNKPTGPTTPPDIEALKNKFFQLEVGRLQGNISAEEHASARRSLEQSMQRVLRRSGAAKQ